VYEYTSPLAYKAVQPHLFDVPEQEEHGSEDQETLEQERVLETRCQESLDQDSAKEIGHQTKLELEMERAKHRQEAFYRDGEDDRRYNGRLERERGQERHETEDIEREIEQLLREAAALERERENDRLERERKREQDEFDAHEREIEEQRNHREMLERERKIDRLDLAALKQKRAERRRHQELIKLAKEADFGHGYRLPILYRHGRDDDYYDETLIHRARRSNGSDTHHESHHRQNIPYHGRSPSAPTFIQHSAQPSEHSPPRGPRPSHPNLPHELETIEQQTPTQRRSPAPPSTRDEKTSPVQPLHSILKHPEAQGQIPSAPPVPLYLIPVRAHQAKMEHHHVHFTPLTVGPNESTSSLVSEHVDDHWEEPEALLVQEDVRPTTSNSVNGKYRAPGVEESLSD
jgi:hypothetical protein